MNMFQLELGLIDLDLGCHRVFLTFGKELNKFFKFFFSFFRAFIASNVDICRSDSWYCLDNSFHDYDHFILCQNASLLLSIGFFKQTQTVRY